MPRGLLIVVSGPSGAGKSSILEKALREQGLATSISCTTRKPRPGEREGDEYLFLTREEFMRRVNAGEMAEYAEVFGNLYGTPKMPLEQNLAAGNDVITDVDVQGARQLKKTFPDAVMIFVAPPSRQALECRLRKRHTEDDASIARRLRTADLEMADMDMYDYVVVNDVLAEAVRTVSAIRRAERAKRTRVREEFRW